MSQTTALIITDLVNWLFQRELLTKADKRVERPCRQGRAPVPTGRAVFPHPASPVRASYEEWTRKFHLPGSTAVPVPIRVPGRFRKERTPARTAADNLASPVQPLRLRCHLTRHRFPKNLLHVVRDTGVESHVRLPSVTHSFHSEPPHT